MSRPIKVYASGAMSGIADLNFPAFNAASAKLRALGAQVVNPAELNADNQGDWHACMRADIRALCDCDAIVMLPGWEGSQGAHLELHIAHRLGMKVYQLQGLVDELTAAHQLAMQSTDAPPAPTKPEYAYSLDGEGYTGRFASVSAAAAEGLELTSAASVMVGQIKPVTAHDFVQGRSIIDNAQEAAFDEHGEFGDDWLQAVWIDKAKLGELEKLVGDWLQAQDAPNFFGIENEVEVSRAEVEERADLLDGEGGA